MAATPSYICYRATLSYPKFRKHWYSPEKQLFISENGARITYITTCGPQYMRTGFRAGTLASYDAPVVSLKVYEWNLNRLWGERNWPTSVKRNQYGFHMMKNLVTATHLKYCELCQWGNLPPSPSDGMMISRAFHVCRLESFLEKRTKFSPMRVYCAAWAIFWPRLEVAFEVI